MNPSILNKAALIKLLILDVDGVLTDGRLYYSQHGEELKVFHAHDGAGMRLLKKTGVEIAIISCRNSAAVNQRLTELGIKHIYQGQIEKTTAFKELCDILHLTPLEIAYVGDDLPDLPVMKAVGLSIAVSNATHSVKAAADWQTEQAGGLGAVREVCELLLKAQDSNSSL